MAPTLDIVGARLANPDAVLDAARRLDLELAIACAVVQKESGGRNIYGHDRGGTFSTRDGPVGVAGRQFARGADIPVTEANFVQFERLVGSGAKSNGVGPVQVTFRAFFPQARHEGLHLWEPADNMVFGLRILTRTLNGSTSDDAIARAGTLYNAGNLLQGVNGYGRDLVAKTHAWRERLAGAQQPAAPAESVFVVTADSLNIRTGPGANHPTFGSPLPRGTRWFATGTTSGRFVEGRSPFMKAHGQPAQWVHGAFLAPPVKRGTRTHPAGTTRPAQPFAGRWRRSTTMDATVEKLMRVVAQVREWEFTVTVEPGWETRSGRGDRACRATLGVEHWTASPNTTTRELVVGQPKLPVLCNVQLMRDGRLHLIAGRYANHAGRNDGDTLALAAHPPMDRDNQPGPDSATFSANGHAIGMEGNAGPGSDYTRAMHEAASAWWAGCAVVFGWDRTRPPVLGHKEITRRKPLDPSHSMAERRRQVAAFIAARAGGGGEPIVEPMGLLDCRRPHHPERGCLRRHRRRAQHPDRPGREPPHVRQPAAPGHPMVRHGHDQRPLRRGPFALHEGAQPARPVGPRRVPGPLVTRATAPSAPGPTRTGNHRTRSDPSRERPWRPLKPLVATLNIGHQRRSP